MTATLCKTIGLEITSNNIILLHLMSKDKRIGQQKSTIRQSSPTLVNEGENTYLKWQLQDSTLVDPLHQTHIH